MIFLQHYIDRKFDISSTRFSKLFDHIIIRRRYLSRFNYKKDKKIFLHKIIL